MPVKVMDVTLCAGGCVCVCVVGWGGGVTSYIWHSTSYIWHSTDVRAEKPPFSALPGI